MSARIFHKTEVYSFCANANVQVVNTCITEHFVDKLTVLAVLHGRQARVQIGVPLR